MRRVAVSGSSAAQMAETIASPAPPAAFTGAASSAVMAPIATHGSVEAAQMAANP
jgi:hypothetical protein